MSRPEYMILQGFPVVPEENTISSTYASIETKAVTDLEKLISFFEE